MKRLLITALFTLYIYPLVAQLYHPGEVLEYRVSYKAKMFPNTEVGAVEVSTTQEVVDGQAFYKVRGVGRTLPTYRWFYNMEDTYNVWIDTAKIRPVIFESNIKEGDYTFTSRYNYNWKQLQVMTRWQRKKQEELQKTMPLTTESLDPISLFFSMRSSTADSFKPNEERYLQMVLHDTIRHLRYRFLGRENKKIRNMGRYKTLKFDCQLGTTEGFSFTDGTVFTVWISDDQNKIPLYIESPVRIGSIQAYIQGYKGLKYPVTSLDK